MAKEINKLNKSHSYIEWIVAVSVMFATTFTVAETFLDSFYPVLRIAAGIARNFFLLLLFVYQIMHYGLKLKGKGMLFFTIYSIYVLLYITIFPVYKLDDLVKAPTSIFNFFYRTGQVYLYLFCSKTILEHFNVTKFVLTSLFVAILPSIAVIQYIGPETLLMFGTDDDSEFSVLALGYCNGPLIVLSVLFCVRMFKAKYISLLFSIAIAASASYILLTGGERGPIIWTIVNISACLMIKAKHLGRALAVLMIGIILFILNLGNIIDGLESISPHAAEKMESTFVEGDTNGRFDLDNSQGSTYIIGLRQFASSPIYGSYFRLITNHPVFRGHYPHNLFVEILITMGLFGFIPFIYLMIVASKKMYVVLRREHSDAEEACIALFISTFLQLLTTATLVFNAAFWCFLYIVCNLNTSGHNKNRRLRVRKVLTNSSNG